MLKQFTAAIFCSAMVLSAKAADLHRYDSPNCIILTNLPFQTARQAQLRFSYMNQMYRQVLGNQPENSPKVTCYLYQTQEEYQAAGGPPGTAGIFRHPPQGKILLAVIGQNPTLSSWHTLQHEGFHQFIDAPHTTEKIPPWLNEGLAEYFGEALFTGDDMTLNLIPPWRLARLKSEITANHLHPAAEIFALTPTQWATENSVANYDQAWSMVHFILQQPGGVERIKNLLHGQSFQQACTGRWTSASNFEQDWKQFWLNQPPDPTEDLFARAVLSTLTSFLARADAAGQYFDSLEAFIAMAQAGNLRALEQDWLPPSLAQQATAIMDRYGTWQLLPDGNQMELKLTLKNGKVLEGKYHPIREHKPRSISVITN